MKTIVDLFGSEEEYQKFCQEQDAKPRMSDEEFADLEDWHRTYGTPESQMLRDMISKGFRPIAITVMMCEETFVFRGEKEAKDAWEIYKNEGWWYGLGGFINYRIDYVKDIYKGKIEDAPIVYWLDKNYEQEI